MRKLLFGIATAVLAVTVLCAGCAKPVTGEKPKLPDTEITAGDECTGVEIKRMPDKITYYTGDRFNPEGIVFDATYKNGYAGDAGLGVNDLDGWSPFGPLTPDVTSVTIKYMGVEKSVAVNVGDRSISGIRVTTEPSKKTYDLGDAVSFDGLVVSAVYEDGLVKDIDAYEIVDDAGKIYKNGTILENGGRIDLKVRADSSGQSLYAGFSLMVYSGATVTVEAEATVTGEAPTDASYTVITGTHKFEDGNGRRCLSNTDVGTKLEFYVYSETEVRGADLVFTAASLNRGNNETYDVQFNALFSLKVDDEVVSVGNDRKISGRKLVGNERIWFLWTENIITQVDLKAGFTKITFECIGKVQDSNDGSMRAVNIDKIDIKY